MSFEVFDSGVPHSARVYDYLLGGKDNYAADREAAEKALMHLPSLRTAARANRGFMVRAARYLVAEGGLSQFLDIGTGLPTSPNLHEVVQAMDEHARVVYVDNDPLVLVHARALLASTPEGRTTYIEADLRNVESILAEPQVRRTLDLDSPVVVSLIGILHFIADDEAALRIVSTLLEPLVPGSALMLSMVTADADPDAASAAFASLAIDVTDVRPRTRDEVEAFFRGLRLLGPGVVPVHQWHPDDADSFIQDEDVHLHCGVAVKP